MFKKKRLVHHLSDKCVDLTDPKVALGCLARRGCIFPEWWGFSVAGIVKSADGHLYEPASQAVGGINYYNFNIIFIIFGRGLPQVDLISSPARIGKSIGQIDSFVCQSHSACIASTLTHQILVI